MTKVNIPTAEELSKRLGGLERLLTARKWERAAIVWAFTTNTNGRPANEGNPSDVRGFPMPTGAFAQLGFAGLASEQTVRKYRTAWQDAVDAGLASPVAPGDTDVKLPDMAWPRTGNPDGFRTTTKAPAEDKAALVVRLLEEPGVDSALEQLQAEQVHQDAKRKAQAHTEAGQPVGWQPRSSAERQERVERITNENPAARHFDQAEAVTDLSRVLNNAAASAERFTEQITDCLHRMGDGSAGWDEFAALSDTLSAAQRAVQELTKRLDDVEQYQTTGVSPMDAGLREILRNGEK